MNDNPKGELKMDNNRIANLEKLSIKDAKDY